MNSGCNKRGNRLFTTIEEEICLYQNHASDEKESHSIQDTRDIGYHEQTLHKTHYLWSEHHDQWT